MSCGAELGSRAMATIAIAEKSKTGAPKRAAKASAARMSLAETMRELELAGSEQTRKTYARHGAAEPMFGVSFATLKGLLKRIGVDHELACALWETGNFDARNLAVKIVDPLRLTSAELDRWAREASAPRLGGGYVAMLASERPDAIGKAAEWLAAREVWARAAGWVLLCQLANRDVATPESWFLDQLTTIERTIHSAPSSEREAMNMAVIAIGCRSDSLRSAASAAAQRIGKVKVDHGDTACKTPDAVAAIEKAWTHSESKGVESPAAQERTRELPRLRC